VTRPALMAAGAGALVGAFALGRYTAPKPVAVEAERQVDAKHEEARTEKVASSATFTMTSGPTVVRRTYKFAAPAPGQLAEVQEEVERGPTRAEATTQQLAEAKVVTRDVVHETERVKLTPVRDDWHVSVLAGWHESPVYGVTLDRRIVGPLTIGLAATSERAVFLSAGVRW
jgi:hypothetical protein